MLPQSREAEADVLSALLVNDYAPIGRAGYMARLKVGDFFDEDHRAMFAAMQECFESNPNADSPIINDHLKRQGRWTQKRFELLGYMADNARAVSPNIEYYIDKVISFAKRRAEILSSDAKRQAAENPLLSDEQRAEIYRQEDEALAEQRARRVPKDFSFDACISEAVSDRSELKSGKISCIPIQWQHLSESFAGYDGIPPATLGLMVSRMGTGKTWFALSCAEYAIRNGRSVFYFNTEMRRSSVAERMIAINGIGDIFTDENEVYRQFGDQMRAMKFEVTPPNTVSPADAVSLIDEKSRDFQLVILDHLGELAWRGKRFEEYPRFVHQVRDIVRSRKNVVMIVSHLKNVDEGDMLSHSKEIENIVDWSWSMTATGDADCSTVSGGTVRLNRKFSVRKNRFGLSLFNIAMLFDDKLQFHDNGIIKKIFKKQE